MATEQKITTEAAAKQALANQINELEALFQKSEEDRKKQFLISVCALLSMIIILTVAILNLASYFRNYPKKLLMREVFLHARPMLYTPWNIRGNSPQERRILRQTNQELEKTLKIYMPQIRHALRQTIRDMRRYTKTALKSEFEKNLYTALQVRAAGYLKEKSISPSRAHSEKIRALNKTLAAAMTEKIFHALENSMKAHDRFREEINFLRRTGQTALLEQESKIILEERLLHSFLEILPDVCTSSETGGLHPPAAGNSTMTTEVK